MFSLFKKSERKAKTNAILALDIGTEFAKALVIQVVDGKAHILGTGRCRQKLGDMYNGAIMDIASVVENSKRAIKDAERMAGMAATQVILGIAGELVKGDTSTVTYTRKNPEEKIDLAELKNIVQKVQWKCFEEVRSRLAEETGYNEIDIKLVNAAVVGMNIDGYKVSNPLGFQGKEVEISIYNAFAPLVHYGALQTIAAELDMDLLAITVEPYAVARSLTFEDGGDYSAIFIDIGGGTTDIAVVKNGAVLGTKMFTIGGRVFTKRLSQILNVSHREAEEVKIAYSNDMLDKNSYKIVREAMKMDADTWVSGIELSLNEFYNVDVLPSRIYICGGGSHLPEIKEILETQGWYKNLPFSSQPKVRFLEPQNITTLVDKTGKLNDPSDITPMALGNIALELAGEEQMLYSLLKKVVKLMQV
jgi:cell division protein FtsA